MSTRSIYAGVFILLIVAGTGAFALYKALSEDRLLVEPYAHVFASSSSVVPGSKSALIIDRVFSTSSDVMSLARVVPLGQTGVTAFIAEARVVGDPVIIRQIEFTMSSVLERDLHDRTVSRVYFVRDDKPDRVAQAEVRSCKGSVCTFLLDTESLFKDAPITYSEPVRLRLRVDVAGPGEATLADAFQFSIREAGQVKAYDDDGALVSVHNYGSVPAALHITPFNVRVLASWPVEPTAALPSSSVLIGTFEVHNDGDFPVYLDSVVLDAVHERASRVRYSLRASADGSNPNDAAIIYANNSSNGVFGRLSSVDLESRKIMPRSWRFLSVFAHGEIAEGDVFQVAVPHIGHIRYMAAESDLQYTGNPASDGDLSDVISGLLTSGVPRLGRIIMR